MLTWKGRSFLKKWNNKIYKVVKYKNVYESTQRETQPTRKSTHVVSNILCFQCYIALSNYITFGTQAWKWNVNHLNYHHCQWLDIIFSNSWLLKTLFLPSPKHSIFLLSCSVFSFSLFFSPFSFHLFQTTKSKWWSLKRVTWSLICAFPIEIQVSISEFTQMNTGDFFT